MGGKVGFFCMYRCKKIPSKNFYFLNSIPLIITFNQEFYLVHIENDIPNHDGSSNLGIS